MYIKISGFVTQHSKAYYNEVLGYTGMLTGKILQRWGRARMQEREGAIAGVISLSKWSRAQAKELPY